MTVAFGVASPSAHAEYDFGGGSCVSQGSWTQKALQQTRELESIINKLKDDPNCKGIESVVQDIAVAKENLDPGEIRTQPTNLFNANRLESLPGEIEALRQYAKSNRQMRKDVNELLIKTSLEGIDASVNDKLTRGSPQGAALGLMSFNQRLGRATSAGLSALNSVMKVLPNYKQCLSKAPNQALALIGATVSLTGAFVSGGGGVMQDLGNTIANFVTFLRDNEFANILRGVNETQFWMSMSCLTETVAQSYCSTQDAFSLLDYQAEVNNLSERIKKEPDSSNPIEGYFLLQREIPVISDWLQKIQFGVQPQVNTDATYKNQTLDSTNELQKSINIITSFYGEMLKTRYKTLDTDEAKRNMLKTLIWELSVTSD